VTTTARHEHQTWFWNADARCTDCGHRTYTSFGEPVRNTRELPAILWPFELTARLEARIRGHLARRGRLS
jgi:hypothetical protein